MNRWIRRAFTTGAAALALAAGAAAFANDYLITLTDLTTGQPFSPPVFVTHDSTVSLWMPGAAASNGIRQIAESGNRTPLVNSLTPLVGTSILSLVTPLSSPLLPGQSVSARVSADAAHPYFSSAWMLGKTNDTFSGQNTIDLFSLKGTETFDLVAYDAGTEVNTELASDLAAFGGTGHVAENGVIHTSDGIRGIDHYVNGLGVDVNGVRTDAPASWRFGEPVARFTITAVPEPGTIALVVGIGLPGMVYGLKRRHARR